VVHAVTTVPSMIKEKPIWKKVHLKCLDRGSPTLTLIEPSRYHDDSISPFVVQPSRETWRLIIQATCNGIANEPRMHLANAVCI